MKRAILITTRPPLARKSSWSLACVLALALGTYAPAQSATNFDTKKIAPKAAPKSTPSSKSTPAPKSTPSGNDSGAVAAGPSRLVSPDDLGTYVQSLSSLFSMKARDTDPFGQTQDPDAKPIIKPTMAKTTRRVATPQVTPFADIIRLIQVSTIMPGERRFLIGTRSFKQGDLFPINFRGRSIKVEVSSVSSRQIDFRSLESGETASIKLELLPVGMTPGSRGISAPGMVPDRPDAPLELEPGQPSNETSQN